MAATFSRMLVGVAASLERFYKPGTVCSTPPAAASHQAKTALAGVIVPSPGITDNWDSSHDLARQLQMPKDPQGRRQDLRLLQPACRREERSQGDFQAALLDEGAAREPAAQ